MYYWDNTVRHDRPLITNCSVAGLALACGLRPSSTIEERDLDMILTNVALADQEGRPLSYSRHRDHEYRGITFGRVLSAVAKIVAAGLALERRTKPGHRGWQSALRGTPPLAEIFDNHGQEPVYGPRDLIVLRSRKDGSLLPLPPMRDRQRQVERINEMLGGVTLGMDMTGALKLRNNLWLFERLEEDRWGRPKLVRQTIRLDQMGLRRIFTDKPRYHGRVYCAAQNIPGSARLQTTINGKQVVELDFSAMHPTLAYSACGVRMEDNPYEVPGFTRKQAKIGLLTALNAKTLKKAEAALTDPRGGTPVVTNRKDAARLLEALEARHAPIATMLGSDAGMGLMNVDSRIMLTAVDRLIANSISCIPIHDSIIVPAQHEGEAREALNYGWCAVLGSSRAQLNPCNIEKKRPKVPQPGAVLCSLGLPALSGLPAPVDGGWWSAVLSEASLDVAEWCA